MRPITFPETTSNQDFTAKFATTTKQRVNARRHLITSGSHTPHSATGRFGQGPSAEDVRFTRNRCTVDRYFMPVTQCVKMDK